MTTDSVRWFEAPGDYRLGWKAAAGIVAFGASLLLIGLGSTRVLTYHEVVFAEPAKEMLATGDFIVPKIAGIPFYDKPPATAWTIAAAMRLFGSESEWVVRLPSVVAALASAVILAFLATRWFGRTVGVLAGLIQLTTMHTLMQARLAEADTLMAAGVAGALAIFASVHLEGPSGRLRSRWAPWLFYALLGWCVLAKGLIGVSFVAGACGLWLVVTRDLRVLRFLLSPIGIAIFIGMTLPWLLAADAKCPGFIDAQIHHHFGRFSGGMDRNAPPLSYFYFVPLLMLPWTPLVVIGAVRVARTGAWQDRRWWFLACWFVPGMALLSWSVFKSKHYTIPLLPPLAVLAAVGAVEHLRWRYSLAQPRILAWAMLTIVGFTAAITAVELNHTKHAHAISSLLFVALSGVLAMQWCEHCRWPARHLGAMFATIWLVAVGVQLGVMPAHDSYRPQTEMAHRIEQLMPLGQTLRMYVLPENQITWYLHMPIERRDRGAGLVEELEAKATEPLYILGPLHLEQALAQHGTSQELVRCTGLNSYLTERDRLVFFRWTPDKTARADGTTTSR